MPTTYSKSEVEYLCRVAAMRGFQRGCEWKLAHPGEYEFPKESDVATADNAIIGELRAEGKIPHWE